MTEPKEKLCIWCKNFGIDEGWGGTDVTPGENASISCYSSELNPRPFVAAPLSQFYKCINKAKDCLEYKFDNRFGV